MKQCHPFSRHPIHESLHLLMPSLMFLLQCIPWIIKALALALEGIPKIHGMAIIGIQRETHGLLFKTMYTELQVSLYFSRRGNNIPHCTRSHKKSIDSDNESLHYVLSTFSFLGQRWSVPREHVGVCNNVGWHDHFWRFFLVNGSTACIHEREYERRV